MEVEPPRIDGESPGLKAVVAQLVDDSRAFVHAEIDFLRAQAGERASYALPGAIMVAVAGILAFGIVVAALVGAMLWLTPVLGAGWALLAVSASGALLATVVAQLGKRRLVAALKPPEKR